MIALAPGKLVLSGAYAVLEGAPALVAAVDRYVRADSSRRADRITAEVSAALSDREDRRAPWFDASALRTGGPDDRKIGLGSSAAILVASLAALELEAAPELSDEALAARILRPAIDAHRRAQGGGSGIDVVASTLGGVQLCVVAEGSVTAERTSLPPDLVIEAWSSPASASTSGMLEKVFALREGDPRTFGAIMSELAAAAEDAAKAREGGAFLEAARAQLRGFTRLGALAGAPIVTPANAAIAEVASGRGATVLPSGAGGGDVVLWIGLRASDRAFGMLAEEAGFSRLEVCFGARGAHPAKGVEKNHDPTQLSIS